MLLTTGWSCWLVLLVGLVGWFCWLVLLVGLVGWSCWLVLLVGLVGWSCWWHTRALKVFVLQPPCRTDTGFDWQLEQSY
jgi:hypothetical protein